MECEHGAHNSDTVMSLAKKNRSELLEELETLRARLADLDKSDDKRKRAEDALRESEKRYRNIYEIAPLAFVIWDQECRITDWNERA